MSPPRTLAMSAACRPAAPPRQWHPGLDEFTSLAQSHGMGVCPVAGHACLDLVNSHVNPSTDSLRQVIFASLAAGLGLDLYGQDIVT